MITFEDTYTILETLGSGGGGTVYKAYHTRLQKEVALKKIHSNLQHINARTETDILKNIKHEYLPQILDFIEAEDGIYTVMEYISGKSFEDYLNENRVFEQKDIIVWFTQLFEALEVLHRQKPPIIHGDIKPANIMLTTDGRICLIDFNIASIFEGTKTIVSGYTPGYAAPEQMAYCMEALKAQKKKRTLQATGNLGNSNAAVSAAQAPQAVRSVSEGTVVLDQGAAAQDQGTVVLDQGTAAQDQGTVVLDQGAAAQNQGTVVLDSSSPAAANPTNSVQNSQMTSGDSTFGMGLTEAQKADMHVAWDAETYRNIVDARVDIYSLGATIYHLVTGSAPKSKDGTVQDIRRVNPKVNPVLADIIMKCLAANPDERYQSITEVHTALKNIYQSQTQYKKLVARQRVIRVGLLAGVLAFSMLAFAGVRKIGQERTLAWQEAIEEARKCLETRDEEKLEEYFTTAVNLFSNRAEAYEIKARLLLEQRNYEACERFLVESAIPFVTDGTGLCNLYLILGNSYLEEEDYAAAVDALSHAVASDETNASAYGDYAVALARKGETDEAKKQLEKAISAGLGQSGILYTSGELKFADRDWEEADKLFMECLTVVKDAYMQERAVMMRLKIQNQYGVSKETCEAKLQIIDQAVFDYGSSMERALLQEKVQTCVDLASITNDMSYNEIALKALDQIIRDGTAAFADYQNKVMLLLNMKSETEAQKVLEEMTRRYGDDYRISMWYAFAEAQLQMDLENEKRDYRKFDEYYRQAKRLYQEQTSQNYTNPYMANLEGLYQDVKDKGWMEE